VSAFAADTTLTVRRQVEHLELLWAIKAVADEMDASFAIRFDGALDAVRARSVAPQYLSGRARSVVAATQEGHFTLGPAVGTLVASRSRAGPTTSSHPASISTPSPPTAVAAATSFGPESVPARSDSTR
jgi:hypothetical protein